MQPEEGALRFQDFLPHKMYHADPSPDDADDESWAEGIDFQQPNGHIDSRTGGQWTSFAAFFKNPDCMMEKTGRYDAGPPAPIFSEPSAQAHKAKPLH